MNFLSVSFRTLVFTILALLMPWGGLLDAKDIFVDVNFSGTSDGSSGAPYKKIMDGVNAAASGDVVRIKSGTYIESLTLGPGKNNITLKRDSETATVVVRPSASTSNGIYFDRVMGDVIDGLRVEKANYGIYLRSTTNCVVQNVTTVSNQKHGIVVYLSAIGNAIKGNIVQSNTEGQGIRFDSVKNNTMSDNQVIGNLTGLYLVDSDENTVSGNTITDSGNQSSAILVDKGSDNNLLMGNQVNANKGSGIALYQTTTGNSIYGNTVRDNLWDGVYLSKAASTDDHTNTIIAYNNIYGNSRYNIENLVSSVADASHNYYGTTDRNSFKVVGNLNTELYRVRAIGFVRYVDATLGDDSTIDGESFLSPFKSIGKAISQMGSGDLLLRSA